MHLRPLIHKLEKAGGQKWVGSLEKRLRQVGNGPRLSTETACRKERRGNLRIQCRSFPPGASSCGHGTQVSTAKSQGLGFFPKMQHHRLGVLFCFSAPVGLWRGPAQPKRQKWAAVSPRPRACLRFSTCWPFSFSPTEKNAKMQLAGESSFIFFPCLEGKRRQLSC